RTMQDNPQYTDVVSEIVDYLKQRLDSLADQGIDPNRVSLDPGIGFGKTARQSAALVASSAALAERSGCAVLIGASRKRFLAAIGSRGTSAGERTLASVTAAVLAAAHGAAVVRVHDVAATAEALEVGAAIELEWARARPLTRSGRRSF
ncbi:MAG: dihydropteroate synthase, partial [Myxococcales bacterium]|nr:dihydropteroate synthase [Myxococcales bacterium]